MIAFRAQGPDPEHLAAVDTCAPTLKGGEALVRVVAAGVNFVDVRMRRRGDGGALGMEGAGIVEEVGPGETGGFVPGDRVAWAMHPGAYAELAAVPARLLVRVPDPVSLELAAGSMLQGLTAGYLANDSYAVAADEWVLVHSAAGGVGQLLTQVAAAKGARVLGTVSSPAKEPDALDAGAEVVVCRQKASFAATARELTGGVGMGAVYDGIGRATFDENLRTLRRRGTLVIYGETSGPAEPFAPKELQRRGSLTLTYPGLADFISDRGELLRRAAELFDALTTGTLRPAIDQRLLAEVARTHVELEAGRTTGKLVLTAT